MNFDFPLLLIANLFHPVSSLAIKLFLNGNMGHGRGPVAPCQCFSPEARYQNYITWMNFMDLVIPSLY